MARIASARPTAGCLRPLRVVHQRVTPPSLADFVVVLWRKHALVRMKQYNRAEVLSSHSVPHLWESIGCRPVFHLRYVSSSDEPKHVPLHVSQFISQFSNLRTQLGDEALSVLWIAPCLYPMIPQHLREQNQLYWIAVATYYWQSQVEDDGAGDKGCGNEHFPVPDKPSSAPPLCSRMIYHLLHPLTRNSVAGK